MEEFIYATVDAKIHAHGDLLGRIASVSERTDAGE